MTVLVTLATLYVLLVVIALIAQRGIMYPAPRDPEVPSVVGSRLLHISGDQGRTVYAFYVEAPAGAPVVVHFHGNGEALVHQTWLADVYRASGIGFYAVEYPGYGLANAYTPSKDAILSDAARALAYLQGELGVSVDRIVLEGQSLGTGVVAELARRKLGARLILVSPYTSTVDVAQKLAPIFPMRLILRDQFDTERLAPQIAIPTLVIHGNRDTLIPLSMGRRIVSLMQRARLLTVVGAGHNDVLERGGESLWRQMTAFARGHE